MKKTELNSLTETYKAQTKEALQLLWDNVNKGQKNKILKNPEVKAMLDRYGVVYE